MNEYLPALSRRGVRWLRFLAVVVAVALLLLFAYRIQGVLNPILLALAIAYVVNPVVVWLKRARDVPRLHSTIAIFGVGSLAAATLTIILAVPLVEQTSALAERLAGASGPLLRWVRDRAPDLLGTSQPTRLLQDRGAAVVGSAFAALLGILSWVSHWLSLLFLLPMYAFVFIWKFDDIVAAIRDHLPYAVRDTVVSIARTTDRAMADFFRGRLIVCAAVGFLTAVGWWVVGVAYAIPLGLLMGALNLVPFLSIIGLPFVLLIAFLSAHDAGQSWVWPVVGAMIVYMLVQAIESFALAPYLLSQSSGLHPITTVIVLLVGAELAGAFGMLLSIPLASTLKTLAGEFLMPEIRRLAAGPPVGPPAAPPDPSAGPTPHSPESTSHAGPRGAPGTPQESP